MSVIDTIYANIAAMGVTVATASGDVTPAVVAPDALPLSAETAQLPLRVLDPFNLSDQGQYTFVAYGTTATVRWQIVDLLLWEEVGQSRGPIDNALPLIQYCGAYAEAVRQRRGIAAQAAIERVTPTIGVYEWPVQSARWYYGVRVELEIEEVLSG